MPYCIVKGKDRLGELVRFSLLTLSGRRWAVCVISKWFARIYGLTSRLMITIP